MRIRDGQIDVALLAGPRLGQWPTQGARVLSKLCADAGLKTGWYGGPGLKVRGVMPLESGGALVMVEDAQGRLHRIQSRAVVKITPELEFPLPFPGWYSPGLIPLSTARKLLAEGSLNWQSVVVILGTGNRALRLGSELLERNFSSRVVCLESVFDRVQGWEVEYRRFQMRGGKIAFGHPVGLEQRSPFIWSIKIQDPQGVRVIDAARVVSAGPFAEDSGYREYPSGSLLFEWENSEAVHSDEEVERILLDENRAVVLAARVIRGLSAPSAEFRSSLDKQLWASKQKLKELETLNTKRFEWTFDGKWLSPAGKSILAGHEGVPKRLVAGKIKASIECIEPIGCRACEKSCPAGAIRIDREKKSFLIEDACTGCGFCLQACPSQVPVMIDGDASGSFTTLIYPFTEKPLPKKGDRVSLLSRKGDVLAQSRILDVFLEGKVPLFKVEVPSHLIWEARGFLAHRGIEDADETQDLYGERGSRVEVQIQGEVRRVRENQGVSVALFEIGMARPNDTLLCGDGSCGLCQIEVDGIKRFACETRIHQGMNIRFTRDHPFSSELCPCEGVEQSEFQDRIRAMNPETLEAVTQGVTVGSGRCHGLLCRKSWVRLAEAAGVQGDRYLDWRFPWMDWVIK
jgi:ferredoxin